MADKEEPRRPYIVAVIRVAVAEYVEDVDMPRLLDKYREEGSAELVSAEIRDLTYGEASILAAKLAKDGSE